MSDPGWWARNVGPAAPQQQRPPQPSPVVHQRQPMPPQQQVPQQQRPQQQVPQQPVQVDPTNLYEQALQWQGGQGVHTETQPCPKCGGMHYFSRARGVSRGPAPAPLCADCGFNGMFEQADPGTWQGGGG